MHYSITPQDVLSTPDLICFWDFQEPTGQLRVASGPYPYELRDQGVPVERVCEGIFGEYSAEFQAGSCLSLPRAECPALNIHGEQAQVSVVAWVQRFRQEPEWCDFIAGLWDEGAFNRQYALFLACGLSDVPSHRQVIGHISATGGGDKTRFSYCDVAASGRTEIPYDDWVTVGMTYDGKKIRAYLNGSLDESGLRNPYVFEKGIYDAGPSGADFTVGGNHLPVDAPGPRHDQHRNIGCPFKGRMGGLAVFRRALSDAELWSFRLEAR